MQGNLKSKIKYAIEKQNILKKNIIKALDIKNVLCLFNSTHSKKASIILITIVIAGLIMNYSVPNPLPRFNILIAMLSFCIVSSFYTTSKIIECQDKFSRLMAGDSILLVLRTEYIKKSYRCLIYIPVIIFGIIVPTAAFFMIGISINIFIKVFCFLGLSFTVMICTLGAIQYLILLIFMHKIRISIKKIKNYDDFNPQNTPWFKELFRVTRICNNLFLAVGLVFVIAFCVFSLSDKFAIDLSNPIVKTCLLLFWTIIVIFIIAGAIFLTLSSNNDAKKILDGLFDSEQAKLNDNYIHANDINIKNFWSIQLSLMVIKRNTKKLFTKSLFSYILSAIDAIAAAEATLALVAAILNVEIADIIKLITYQLPIK